MQDVSARVRLRVTPGAARAGVVGRHADGWKVHVAGPPEDGRANDAVRKLLADALGVPRSAVTIVSGHGARDKIVELAGLRDAELDRRLASLSRKDQ